MLANGIWIWSAAFTKLGSDCSWVHQKCSNSTFWNCLWVWQLALISVMSYLIKLLLSLQSRSKKQWIQYLYLISVEVCIHRNSTLWKSQFLQIIYSIRCNWDSLISKNCFFKHTEVCNFSFLFLYSNWVFSPQKLLVFLYCLGWLCHIHANMCVTHIELGKYVY